jgi:hypothetical protein
MQATCRLLPNSALGSTHLTEYILFYIELSKRNDLNGIIATVGYQYPRLLVGSTMDSIHDLHQFRRVAN